MTTVRSESKALWKRGNFAESAGLFIGLVILNACLVSPYIGWYDSGEMVGTTLCLGISHPSGQVLFHLLGKVFLLLPFSTPAYRLGLMSVVCSALASVLFFNLSLRLTGPTPSGRIKFWTMLLTLAWSFSLPWWRYSLTPLVYALHLMLGLLILWALSLEKPGKWPLVFFILGIATVFRPTQFFALPLVGLAFGWDLFRLDRKFFDAPADWFRKHLGKGGGKNKNIPILKLFLMILAAFILGRSTAVYLPIRSALHPELAYAGLTTFHDFFQHLFALRFSKYVGGVSGSTVQAVLTQMISHLWNDLTFMGLALLAAGLFLAFKTRRQIPVFLWVGLGWGLLEGLFVFTIPFPTFESHQVLLGWVYSGLFGALTLGYLDQWSGRDKGRALAVGGVLVLLVLAQSFSWGHLWERRQERGAQDYARNILELMPEGSLYLPNEENEYFPVVGVQQSFQFKKSIEVVEPGTSPEAIAPKIKNCLEQGRSLFVSRKWALPAGWSFQALGSLMKVGRNFPEEAPRKISPSLEPLALWGKIGLVEAVISPAQVKAGDKVEITYRWVRRGLSPSDNTQSVVGLFADPQGNYWMKNNVFWFHDIHESPLGGFSRLKPGFEVEEKRILFVPSDFPPGRYRLSVGLQSPASFQQTGREVYGREFYERSGYQNLGKFMGRGENGAVVQFSAATSNALEMGLWPLTRLSGKPSEVHFAPAAELEILPPDNTNP